MNKFCKIYIFALLVLIPFSFVNAQHTGKKKKSTVHSAQKRQSKTLSKKGTVSRPESTSFKKVQAEPVQIESDETAPKVVTVTSAFKPSLRNAAKINFMAATPVTDSARIPVNYNIPSQNLFFTYQPVSIKPVAFNPDSGFKWVNNQYIKLGYGNYATPFAEAGFAFGDGKKTIFDLTGNYVSSKGSLPYQEFSKVGLKALGIFNSANNELTTNFFFNNST